MFDTLADRIKADEPQSTGTMRALRMVAIFVIAAVLFGGLYFGLKMLE